MEELSSEVIQARAGSTKNTLSKGTQLGFNLAIWKLDDAVFPGVYGMTR